jgi:hypothetical protein
MGQCEAVELVDNERAECDHGDRIGPELVFEQRTDQADLDDSVDQEIDRGKMFAGR